MTASDRRILALALLLALVIGVGWRLTERGPFAAGSRHEVTIHELEGCGIPADVVVGDRIYEPDSGWPDAWPARVAGELVIDDGDGAATFTAGDGRELHFHQVGGIPTMACPTGG